MFCNIILKFFKLICNIFLRTGVKQRNGTGNNLLRFFVPQVPRFDTTARKVDKGGALSLSVFRGSVHVRFSGFCASGGANKMI